MSPFTEARSILHPSAGNPVFLQHRNIPKFPNVSVLRRVEQVEPLRKPYTVPFANSAG